MNACLPHGPYPFRPSAALFLLPVAMAAVCFSYALATRDAAPRSLLERAQPAAASRFLGSDLRFTNPFLLAGSDFAFPQGGDTDDDPQGFDLGDAVPGAQVVRYINAAGGYLPYTFALKPLLGSQSNASGNHTPTLPDLSPSGIMSGIVPGDAVNFLRFNVQVTDVIGTQRLGTFRLNLFPAGQTGFRFAHNRLPAAQMSQSYFTNIETIGVPAGAPGLPVTFGVVPNSVSVAGVGTAFATLEDVGLTLAPDGVVFGRPIKAGNITFTASASNGVVNALSRVGYGEHQAFTIPVEQGIPLTSETLATRCSIRGNRVLTGADSFTYSGVLDTRGATASKLAGGAFQLRIGGAVFKGTFNARGKISQALSSSGTAAAATKTKGPGRKLTVSLSPPTGRFSIKITGEDIASHVGVTADTAGDSYTTVTLGVDLGSFRTCEVLRMETRTLSKGGFRMDYALGKHGFSRAGGCQVLSVKGADSKPVGDPTGDRWIVRFYGVPGQDVEAAAKATTPATTTPATTTTKTPKTPKVVAVPVFTAPTASSVVAGVTKVTIEIGDFSQDVTVAKQSVRQGFKSTGTTPGIFKMLVDPIKFVHRVETNVLDTNDTGIPAAITTKDPTVFPLRMTFTGFTGDAVRVIAPNRGKWQQQ